MQIISLELLDEQNIDGVRAIHREDISESWVDNADTLWELTQYGLEHNCIGHTYAVKYNETYIGMILLGEAIPWDTDPEEMKTEPFYRLMGFVVDNRWRSQGIGGYVLEKVIATIYREYGIRPIALGVHKDNHGAARFYEKHGFRRTEAMEGNDYYYLRYPNILQGIHATNDYERTLFGAVKEQFNDNLYRWYSGVRPDHYNSNFFTPISDLTRKDVLAAVAFQKHRGINEVMFSTNRPIDLSIVDGYDCVEYSAHVMAMLSDRSHLWQTNEGVEIRDIQTHDISADILDVSDVPQQHQEAAYRNMKMVLEVAKTHPEYHWLCAYKDGKCVGTAYAVEHNGFVEMDDLWVAEEYRHQRIATTIMKHIVDHFGGIVYLHATANATPKDMYAKMGFEIVETVYEYYLEW